MQPTLHLVKSLEVGRSGAVLALWCGRHTALALAPTNTPNIVFQEEFATCQKCRTGFARAVANPQGGINQAPPATAFAEARTLPGVGDMKENEVAA